MVIPTPVIPVALPKGAGLFSKTRAKVDDVVETAKHATEVVKNSSTTLMVVAGAAILIALVALVVAVVK